MAERGAWLLRVGGLAAVVGVVAAMCSSHGASQTAPAPPPSPTGTVVQVLAPSNLVLADGRHVHVAAMHSPPSTSCEEQADLGLANELVGGKTIRVAAAAQHDSEQTVPPGFVQADAWTPTGEGYAETYLNRQADARNAACPLPTVTTSPVPSTSSESSSSTDLDVDVDHDHHESRFCRRHWWC